MTTQHQAQIYKADKRGVVETEIFRRLSTFNFGDYKDASREPFGALLAINDETLGGGNNIIRHLEEDTDILLLPLVGGIVYKDNLGNEDIIRTEELRIIHAQKDMHYKLINPYENDLVNYVQIWLKPQALTVTESQQQPFSLSERNVLEPLFEPAKSQSVFLKTNSGARGFIGIFDGRKEGTYTLKHPSNGLFAFVINGAFEFENRLIESRDGLSLYGILKADFEALSENAIILLFEIPMH